MRRVLILLVAIGGFSFSQGAYAQSYDCSQVRQPDEIAVCRDERLSRLDERVGSLYQRLRQELGPRRAQRLDGARLNYLRRRAGCGPNVHCLEQVYRGWLDELRDYRGRY
jgi:uncharacterized protein